jgi:HD-GYP domain-containing protein (c-di-GMP phosphodiesterase class II)
LSSRSIEALSFQGEVPAKEVQEFAFLFNTVDPGPSCVAELRRQMTAGDIRGIEVKEATAFTFRVNLKTKSFKALAKDLYLKAVGVVGEVLENIKEGRTPSFRQAKRVVQNLVDLILRDESVLLGLTTLRCYDQYTHNHSVNVGLLSLSLGNRAGYPKDALVDLGLAALFHDMGKIAIPVEVLNHPEELSEKEWTLMRTHPSPSAWLRPPLSTICILMAQGILGTPGPGSFPSQVVSWRSAIATTA